VQGKTEGNWKKFLPLGREEKVKNYDGKLLEFKI
jgi:hypothetical protein